MKRVLYLLFWLLGSLTAQGQTGLEAVKDMLQHAPVQEKVYLHLDNQCYFKGDTIWYKAYVVRADNLTYTDMSRILYVELVSPDGMVVERQNIIISPDGYSDGNFALQDSIYSGYYEVRAYTRWMLNFKVSEHDYGYKDYVNFYNRQMAHDFFRQFETIYSRVFPVYERPQEPGDYSGKYIVSRPKTRLEKELKQKLFVNFYPEGGHLIAGQTCRVAFEALDEEGEQQDVKGVLRIPGIKDSIVNISTSHQGRGVFEVKVPENGRIAARFPWRGKDYSFDLPKTERVGCALHLDATGDQLKADLRLGGLPEYMELGVAVLCRGTLRYFQTIKGSTVLTIDKEALPTGVNDLLVFDEMGRLLCDRLFFVNHHDYAEQNITVDEGKKIFEPFEQIELRLQAPENTTHLSIAVRDGATDEPTYDTGTMMTDLLLSSELKGFVAYPSYYFEADDKQHRQHLDLLMMVQGWRHYDYNEMTSGDPLRYTPEQTMTVEGSVYPTVESRQYEPEEVRYWPVGIFGYNPNRQGTFDAPKSIMDDLYKRLGVEVNDSEEEDMPHGDEIATVEKTLDVINVMDPTWPAGEYFQAHGGLKHEVTLEGELVFNDDVATVKMETDNGGHFVFSVPPYYGEAILFLKAYDTDISEKKLKRITHKGVLDESAEPEYYVKRDLFFPVFAKKYDFYQCHQPEEQDAMTTIDDVEMPEVERISKMDTKLKGVSVKGKRRRGRHRIDYSKPACVYDAQELYNLATDRGLSFGIYTPYDFPFKMSMALLGNYNSNQQMHVMARLNDNMFVPYVYYRNYDPGISLDQFRSDFVINRDIKLNRQDIIRIYTDFELRNEDKRVEQQTNAADVTLDFILMPEEGKRYTYRDRRLILPGMYEPDEFYHPDYSRRALPDSVKDYRRTLYWNPNARLDDEGHFTATFYNNGKQTRIKVTAAGLTSDGKPVYYKKEE